MTYEELEKFYHRILHRVRARGSTCAITRGMACVAYGVAPTTKDCDVLCLPDDADTFRAVVFETKLAGVTPRYRGHLTPPLDARWLGGGWTSHFLWEAETGAAYLDVFGVAPRASTPWEAELRGLYVHQHTVAEMKRTDRDKDWPFASTLGVKMLEAGDERGWLHIFDAALLAKAGKKAKCPSAIIAQRPVLKLLADKDERLEIAVRAEVEFWKQLDHVRMRVHARAVRRYMLAVKRDPRSTAADIQVQHVSRVEHAERLLPTNPLRNYGLDRLVGGARAGPAFCPARLHPMVAGCARKLYRFSQFMKSRRKREWLTPSVRRYLRRLEFDYQVSAFGEEMARVNFLPARQRRKYIAEMIDHAESKGVTSDTPALGVTR